MLNLCCLNSRFLPIELDHICYGISANPCVTLYSELSPNSHADLLGIGSTCKVSDIWVRTPHQSQYSDKFISAASVIMSDYRFSFNLHPVHSTSTYREFCFMCLFFSFFFLMVAGNFPRSTSQCVFPRAWEFEISLFCNCLTSGASWCVPFPPPPLFFFRWKGVIYIRYFHYQHG